MEGSSYKGTPYSDRIAQEKRDGTCRDWNEKGCSKSGKDGNHCGFGEGAKRHGCAKILSEGKICWDKNIRRKTMSKKTNLM